MRRLLRLKLGSWRKKAALTSDACPGPRRAGLACCHRLCPPPFSYTRCTQGETVPAQAGPGPRQRPSSQMYWEPSHRTRENRPWERRAHPGQTGMWQVKEGRGGPGSVRCPWWQRLTQRQHALWAGSSTGPSDTDRRPYRNTLYFPAGAGTPKPASQHGVLFSFGEEVSFRLPVFSRKPRLCPRRVRGLWAPLGPPARPASFLVQSGLRGH